MAACKLKPCTSAHSVWVNAASRGIVPWVYGADKVWQQPRREEVAVARCTVERLMRRLGLHGVVRSKEMRTTISDPKQPCPLDRVNRQFKAELTNRRGTW